MRKTFNGKGVTASGPYSHAVDTGDYIYLSGQTAMNAEDTSIAEKVAGDITAQTKQCFKHLHAVLEEMNLDESNVVKVNVYLTSMKHFKAMNAVYETQFKKPYPARTCVAVLELPLEADVEIEFVAKRH
ncbi:2-iminobutanoate/2-iminopropanoate deaminase [Lentibacillus sp. JNUCC-1]|uniref:RidA family protein n=1 Tax=Lentibacillus sp. JNUCC-1 TaxID=2654513 RepID=UPI0012E7E5FE|nr:RidA family protein [Lentibacillus sp. JNUCC-1]MUV38280.1 2-iminobutanoate/2-iminopropanoate deaminase [Lentibacillus sp. JNUCC-1]